MDESSGVGEGCIELARTLFGPELRGLVRPDGVMSGPDLRPSTSLWPIHRCFEHSRWPCTSAVATTACSPRSSGRRARSSDQTAIHYGVARLGPAMRAAVDTDLDAAITIVRPTLAAEARFHHVGSSWALFIERCP